MPLKEIPYKKKDRDSLDARIKLTDEQRKEIRNLYNTTSMSYNDVAREYGVSKRLVMFIVNPEKEKKAKEQFRQRQSEGRYYDKEKHQLYMQKHRLKKKMEGYSSAKSHKTSPADWILGYLECDYLLKNYEHIKGRTAETSRGS